MITNKLNELLLHFSSLHSSHLSTLQLKDFYNFNVKIKIVDLLKIHSQSSLTFTIVTKFLSSKNITISKSFCIIRKFTSITK